MKTYERKRQNFLRAITKLMDIQGLDYSVGTLHQFDGDVADHIAIVADWNKDKLDIHMKILERYENHYYITPMFEDEVVQCCSCNKLCRRMPTSYGAELSYLYVNDEVVCRDCFSESDIEFFVDSPNKGLPYWTLEVVKEVGFKRLKGDFESGHHEGQEDNPIKIMAEYKKDLPEKEFVLVIDEVSQFYVVFSIWGRDYE